LPDERTPLLFRLAPASVENAAEAWVGGIGIYAVSYLFFAGCFSEVSNWFLHGLLLIVLAFLVWLFWLVVLYLNSLILKLLHGIGLFHTLPMRRGQSVLVNITALAMALTLIQRGPFVSEIGAIWLTATAMNLAAAAILAFSNGEPTRQ